MLYVFAATATTLREMTPELDELDASPAQTVLAWLAHRDGVTAPIVGARTVDQLAENLAAASIDLSDEQVDRLTATKPGPYDEL